MAKKIKIQHLYTTTGTTAPTGNLALDYGEISISHTRGQEAIFIMSDENDGEVKFIPKTQIVSLIDTKLGEAGVATEGVISALTANLENHITGNTADSTNLGHVKLVNEDINDGKFTTGNWDGYATGVKHTHSQYLSGVTAGSGQPIVSIIEDGVAKIGLTTGITKQIESGVSGYTKIVEHESKSGKTDEMGHVKIVGGDLSGNTGNTINGEAAAAQHTHGQYIEKSKVSNGLDFTSPNQGERLVVKAGTGITVNQNGVSINSDLLKKWNDAADDINLFMTSATGKTEAIDTLTEIQNFLSGDTTGVQAMLESISALTEDVESNTVAITANTEAINALKNEQFTIVSGTNIGLTNLMIDGKKQITIKHTGPVNDSGVTNINVENNEVIQHGSKLNIINRFVYDKNGHIISASTQELTIPNLPTGSETALGVVKVKSGVLTLLDELDNEDYPKTAASAAHGHTEYVKKNDLNEYKGTNPLVISCGTY